MVKKPSMAINLCVTSKVKQLLHLSALCAVKSIAKPLGWPLKEECRALYILSDI